MTTGEPTTSKRLSRLPQQVWGAIILLCLVLGTFALYHYSERLVDRANQSRHASIKLADELRQSSDDLTRMVRTYVITGDARYKRHFQEILDIRDGKRPRPEHYDDIYWDLVQDNDQRPKQNGPAISLLALMQQAQFSDAEFAKLAEAKRRSDQLAKLEMQAIALVENHSGDRERNRAHAIAILHDRVYHSTKAAIMAPIDELYHQVEQRTQGAVSNAILRSRVLLTLLIVFGLGLLLQFRRISQSERKILGCSIPELHEVIARLGRGDFLQPIQVPVHEQQSSVIGWLEQTRNQLAQIHQAHQTALAEQSNLRDRAESLAEKLSRDRAFLSSMIENSGAVVYVKDKEGVYQLVNRKYEQAVGISRTEVIGKTDADLLPAEVAQQFRDNDLMVINSGTLHEYEEWLQTPDGMHHFISVKYPIRDQHHEIIGICGMSTDISERKQAEQLLLESRNFAENIIETAPEAILVVDESGEITRANSGAEVMFGYPHGALTGVNIDALVAGAARGTHLQKRGQYWQNADTRRMVLRSREVLACRSDGSEFPVEVNLGPTTLSGKPHVVVAVQDVTEQKRLEREIHSHAIQIETQAAERSSLLKKTHQELAAARFVVEHVGIGIAWNDAESGRFTYANQEACRQLGYSREELLQLTIHQINPAYQPEVLRELIKRMLTETPHLRQTSEHLRKDGSAYPLEVELYLQTDAAAPYIISFWRDLSGSK